MSHVLKKNKAVVLLSTMHHDNKVDEEIGFPRLYSTTMLLKQLFIELIRCIITIDGHKSVNPLITKLTFSLSRSSVKKFFRGNGLN